MTTPHFWFSVFDPTYHTRKDCPMAFQHIHYVREYVDEGRRAVLGKSLYRPCKECVQ